MTIINTGYTPPTAYESMSWEERKEFRLLQVEKEQARQWAEMFALDDDVISFALWQIDMSDEDAEYADLVDLVQGLRHG